MKAHNGADARKVNLAHDAAGPVKDDDTTMGIVEVGGNELVTDQADGLQGIFRLGNDLSPSRPIRFGDVNGDNL